jgi:monovalent cation:H+ antiporter-2, CPA2 family
VATRAADGATHDHETISLEGHTIVAGYGVRAQRLVPVLRGAGVPHVVLTLSPDGASAAQRDGSLTLFGDYSRRNILEAAAVQHARALVIADDVPAMTERVVSVARLLNETMIIIAVAETDEEGDALRALGANRVIVVEGSTERAVVEHTLSATRAVDAAAGSAVPAAQANGCSHLDQIRAVQPRTPGGCEECLQIGSRWTHLRMCMTCGHVGCCDTSPNRHARRHYHDSGHPIMQSVEPGESWGWCVIDDVKVTL